MNQWFNAAAQRELGPTAQIALRIRVTELASISVLIAAVRALKNQRCDASCRRCACDIPRHDAYTHWAHINTLIRGATSMRARHRVAAKMNYAYCFLGDQSPAPPGSMSNICQTAQKSSPGLNLASDTRTIFLPLLWNTEMPGSHPPLLDR